MKNRFRISLVLVSGLISSITFGQQPKKQVEPAQVIQKERNVEPVRTEELKTEDVEPKKNVVEISTEPVKSIKEEPEARSSEKTPPTPINAKPISKQKVIVSNREEKPIQKTPAAPKK